MKVFNNPPELVLWVKIHKSRKKTLLGIATWYVPISDLTGFIEGLEFAAKMAQPVDIGSDLAIVSYNRGVLVFSLDTKSVDDWVEQLKAIQVPRSPTKPEKVKIQKVITRVLRLHKLVTEINASISSQQAWVDENISKQRNSANPDYIDTQIERVKELLEWQKAIPSLGETSSISDVTIILKYLDNSQVHHHLYIDAQNQLKNLLDFIQQDQITDEMWSIGVHEAFDRLLCREVMNS
jgi:hypothetical protein